MENMSIWQGSFKILRRELKEDFGNSVSDAFFKICLP